MICSPRVGETVREEYDAIDALRPEISLDLTETLDHASTQVCRSAGVYLPEDILDPVPVPDPLEGEESLDLVVIDDDRKVILSRELVKQRADRLLRIVQFVVVGHRTASVEDDRKVHLPAHTRRPLIRAGRELDLQVDSAAVVRDTGGVEMPLQKDAASGRRGGSR